MCGGTALILSELLSSIVSYFAYKLLMLKMLGTNFNHRH